MWSKLNIKIRLNISLVLHVVYYTLLSYHRSGDLLHVTQSPQGWESTTRYSVSTGVDLLHVTQLTQEWFLLHVTQSPQEGFLLHVTQSPQRWYPLRVTQSPLK